MANVFRSRVDSFKKEMRDMRNLLEGKTVNQFPIFIMWIVMTFTLFTFAYIYFNKILARQT